MKKGESNKRQLGTVDTVPSLNEMTSLRPAMIRGASGREYHATNLLTEMTTAQKNAARDAMAPIQPTLISAIHLLQSSLDDTMEIDIELRDIVKHLKGVDFGELFNQLVFEDLDLRLLAILYLPEDQRWFRPEAVDDRMKDLEELTYYEKFQAFKSFFSSNWSFSPTISQGFIHAVTRPPKTA